MSLKRIKQNPIWRVKIRFSVFIFLKQKGIFRPSSSLTQTAEDVLLNASHKAFIRIEFRVELIFGLQAFL